MHYIDDISNLNSSKIFLYGGLLDIEVPVDAVKFSEKVWGEYTQNIKSNYSIKSGHSMVTDFYGYKCSSVWNPWISNCNYDLAQKSLDYIIGPL